MLRSILNNEKGIALVTSLMITLISLTIIIGLMFMVMQSTSISGATKRYHTALDATYGGSEVIIKDIVPIVLKNYSSPSLVASVQGNFSGIDLSVATTQTCLQAKLVKPTRNWPASCSQDLPAKRQPDLTFKLQGTSSNPYTVYAKIIDTVKGNSSISGIELEGAGVAENSTIINPMHIPYIYRVEVQGEHTQASKEKAQLSVVYAY